MDIHELEHYDIICEALKRYNAEDKKTEFIRHNENLTLNIENLYLLRIHKSARHFKAITQYSQTDMKSIRQAELAFLQHLNQGGMNVQRPVLNSEGKYLTELKDGTYATALYWIQGRTVEKNDVSEELCYKFGQMIASLHKVAKGFRNEGMIKYNSQLVGELKGYIIQSASQMKKEHVSVLSSACDCIADKLQDESEFMALHSDLSLSNILISDGTLVPIDFSLFGYGHPMMDLGNLFGNINGVANRAAIATGYRLSGFEIDFEMLDVCFSLGVLLYIVIHLSNLSEETFQNNIERWCRQIFRPLVIGKRLISDDFIMLNA